MSQVIRVGGSREKANAITVQRIRERYSVDDELKMHRLVLEALITGAEVPDNARAYFEFVEAQVKRGHKLKSNF